MPKYIVNRDTGWTLKHGKPVAPAGAEIELDADAAADGVSRGYLTPVEAPTPVAEKPARSSRRERAATDFTADETSLD